MYYLELLNHNQSPIVHHSSPLIIYTLHSLLLHGMSVLISTSTLESTSTILEAINRKQKRI